MTKSIGIAGAGVWARRVHVPSISAHPDFTVAGVWSRRPERAQALATELACPWVSTFEELLARSDIIDLAVPPPAQPALALQAARHGKHLILEKPVGTDIHELEELQREVDERSLITQVFVTRFFDKARLEALRELRSREWTGAHSVWRSSAYLPGSPFATGWRDQNAVLYDVGPHTISQVAYILGPIVHGRLSRPSPTEVDVTLHHSSGAISSVLMDVGADVPSLEERLTLAGGEGVLEVPLDAVDPRRAFGSLLDHLSADAGRASGAHARSPMEVGLQAGIDMVRLLNELSTGEGVVVRSDCLACVP